MARKKTYRAAQAMGRRETPDVKRQNYRTLALRLSDDGTPSTLDEEARTVEVIAATENRVSVYDYSRWEIVDEILLMDGCRMPPSKQVPLLDSHSRYDTSTVVGSFRAMAVSGDQLVGRAHFSSVPEVEPIWTKIREGHLTDFSVGYSYDTTRATWIEDGDTAVINGRTFTGPVKVVTDWTVRELSVCPIGADEHAKARAGAPPQEKESDMDKRLRAFLERRGLSKDANEAEAWAYLDTLPKPEQEEQNRSAVPEPPAAPAAGADQPTPTAGTQAEVRAERERIKEITAWGTRFDCAALADELIDNGTGLDAARKLILDHVAENASSGPGYRAPAEVGVDEREKFRSAAESAVMLRAGLTVDTPADGATELAGRTLVDLARMSLVRSGQSDSGRPIDVVGRAMTVSDFPNILAGSANAALAQGFESADETWREWCATGSVSNFLTHSAVRAGETDDLDQVPEGTEYKYGDLDEAKEQYSIATYGKLFAITRQAIVNDDLGALADIPAKHGESANRKVGDVAYAVLTANAAMGDSIALFHASHSNLMTAATLSTTSLAEGIKLMKTQKDISSKRRLNIRPQYFLAPAALEGSAEVFFASNLLQATGSTDAVVATANPYSGSYFTRVYDSRLDDDSTTAWYLAGSKGKTVKIFFLDGVMTPYLETRTGWSVDGIEYKVRLDAGAKAMDWRALAKNAGA